MVAMVYIVHLYSFRNQVWVPSHFIYNNTTIFCQPPFKSWQIRYIHSRLGNICKSLLWSKKTITEKMTSINVKQQKKGRLIIRSNIQGGSVIDKCGHFHRFMQNTAPFLCLWNEQTHFPCRLLMQPCPLSEVDMLSAPQELNVRYLKYYFNPELNVGPLE